MNCLSCRLVIQEMSQWQKECIFHWYSMVSEKKSKSWNNFQRFSQKPGEETKGDVWPNVKLVDFFGRKWQFLSWQPRLI